MPDDTKQDQDKAKQPPRQKPTISPDNHDQNIGQRGDALTSSGNKIHGDELEGIIPGRPSQPHTKK